MTQKVLEVKNLYKNFGAVAALKGVNLNIYKGKVTALLGENGAGKSTLIKSISGSLKPNSGIIKLKNKIINFNNIREANKSGISVVHQELQLCENLSIAENIFLGRASNKFSFVNHKKLFKDAQIYLNMLGVKINPRTIVNKLTIAEQQMVEIAKSLSMESKIIILDEPTDSLSDKEVKKLFEVINRLKNKNISFLYVTHRMEEVNQICDFYTIFKDGNFVEEGVVKNIKIDKIIEKMIGRKLEDQYPKILNNKKTQVFEVIDLTNKYFSNINMKFYKGEILGIAGLIGSGRTEFAKTIVGAFKKNSGRILLKNKLIKRPTIKSSINDGTYYVTENRKFDGLILDERIDSNIIISNLKKVKNKIGLISHIKIKDETLNLKKDLNIKFWKISDKVSSLSGGNQQKVLLAKALFTSPEILILDEPTRGVDVGARKEIYKIISNYANKGKSIVIISSDLPEVIGMSQRVAVFNRGRLAGILSRKEKNISEKNIMNLAIKGGEQNV